jgi:citrate lyase subunit beta/citryl-CoA lyase
MGSRGVTNQDAAAMGRRIQPPPRSWLYVPGNRSPMVEGAFRHGADAIVLDLEDSVPASEKEQARRLVAGIIESGQTQTRRSQQRRPLVWVRINRPGTEESTADLRAAVRIGLDGLRVPKVETPHEIVALDRALVSVELAAGLETGRTRLVCGIESALGVVHAYEIASASPRVVGLAFGGADFQADVGATEGPERLETLMARSTLVLASRAAGLNPPVDTVHLAIDDDDALRVSTERGRDLGFFGRSAIHPRQVPIINEVFTPDDADVVHATHLIQAAELAMREGDGSLRLADGTFVDAAILRRAQLVLQLANALDLAPTRGDRHA